ncbi:MAG: twin-arginine translocase TatA/TatE family subunit [Bacillota bacterium]|nr:twin-arginine translocase TatA/TatE family subunit [Bacillota bacterium]
MGRIGPTELLIILLIVVLLFGARRLPEIAHAIGRSGREFRKGLEGSGEGERAAGGDAEPESPPGDGSARK